MKRGRVALRLFLTCWLVYGLHFATNIVREHYPAFSLAERGTLRVDPYLGLHPDLFAYDHRGAFINNNPGTSILAAIPYALVRPLVDRIVARVDAARTARGKPLSAEYDNPQHPNSEEFFRKARARGLDVRFGLAAGVIHLGYTAPLSALAVVVMRAVLLRLGFAPSPALLLSLLYAFGTPVFFRTGFLNQNMTVANLSLFSFALLFRPKGQSLRPAHLLGAGLLAGYTLVCDYSGIIPIAALGLYALARLAQESPPRIAARRVLWMVAGGAVSVSVLLAYQQWAFGNPFLPAQSYMPATPLSVHGWRGLGWPALDLIWKNLFDPAYGLFTAGPLLILAAAAPLLAARAGRARSKGPALGRAEGLLVAGFFLGLLLFSSSISFARLQFNTGVRYMIPAVPFLFLAVAVVLARLPLRLAALLGVLAVFQSWCLAMVRATPAESVVQVAAGGFQLPWLSVLGRMGGQYLGFLANRPPDATALLAGMAAILAALWWPLRSGREARDETS